MAFLDFPAHTLPPPSKNPLIKSSQRTNCERQVLSSSSFTPDPRTHQRRQKNASLIAAAALVHGLVVATRNVGDFRTRGLVNPFASNDADFEPYEIRLVLATKDEDPQRLARSKSGVRRR